LRVLAERLVPDQRDAVVLTVFEGLTAAEAADRLGVSVETIHVRKSRGLSNLRRLINEKGNGPEGRDGTP
jgi:RNA polymerase sigma factor (sigma-70 family)